jgi:hypothetical protein
MAIDFTAKLSAKLFSSSKPEEKVSSSDCRESLAMLDHTAVPQAFATI